VFTAIEYLDARINDPSVSESEKAYLNLVRDKMASVFTEGVTFDEGFEKIGLSKSEREAFDIITQVNSMNVE
jgi:hypothetical protein